MNVLFVANKKLPASDYRVRYGLMTGACDVYFGLPRRPDDVPNSRYVRINVGEGLRLSDLWSLGRLWVLLRRRTFDCVHFSATTLILLGPYVAAAAGTPCLITLTGFGRTFTSKRLAYRMLRPLYWLLMTGAVRIAVRVLLQNTGDLAAMQMRYPCHASKFILIGSGIGAAIRSVERREDDVVVVLLVARLLPDKGIGDFLTVASRLRGPLFRFVLVGPEAGGNAATLQAVQRAAANGDIDYLGELHETELSRQYERSHVLLFPSVGEGMPRVMLEAAFAGLCPIGYDIPANRDLIRAGGGVLVRSGDHEGLIAALERLETDRRLLRSNASAYQQHVVAVFGMDAFMRRMDAVVNSLQHARVEGRPLREGLCHPSGESCVRAATEEDLEAIVDVHQSAFPGFFLTKMGPRFLAAYYRMVIRSPHGIMLVAQHDGGIAGFVSGLIKPAQFYRQMRRSPLRLGIPAVKRLISSPEMLPEVIARVQRIGAGEHPQGRQKNDLSQAELSSLAVRPSQRRLGHGRRLVRAFLANVRSCGMESIRLTTDASGNRNTHDFYLSLGFARSPHNLGTARRSLAEYTIQCNAIERAA